MADSTASMQVNAAQGPKSVSRVACALCACASASRIVEGTSPLRRPLNQGDRGEEHGRSIHRTDRLRSDLADTLRRTEEAINDDPEPLACWRDRTYRVNIRTGIKV